MKIQAIKSCATPSGQLLPGDVAEVETVHGEYLVSAGYAKRCDPIAAKVEPVETATAKPQGKETAARRTK